MEPVSGASWRSASERSNVSFMALTQRRHDRQSHDESGRECRLCLRRGLGQLLEHGDGVWTEEPNLPTGRRMAGSSHRFAATKRARHGPDPVRVARPDRLRSLSEVPRVLRLAEALAYNDANLGVVAGATPAATTRPRKCGAMSASSGRTSRSAPHDARDRCRRGALFCLSPVQSLAKLFSTVLFEQTLIQSRVPFGLAFDHQLRDLSRYKCWCWPSRTLERRAVARIANSSPKAAGGRHWRHVTVHRLAHTPQPTGTGRPLRQGPGAPRGGHRSRRAGATGANELHIPNGLWKLPRNAAALLAAVKQARRKALREVEAPAWVTAELADQPATGTRLLHLINFKYQEPLRDIPVRVRLPQGAQLRGAIVETPDGRLKDYAARLRAILSFRCRS